MGHNRAGVRRRARLKRVAKEYRRLSEKEAAAAKAAPAKPAKAGK